MSRAFLCLAPSVLGGGHEDRRDLQIWHLNLFRDGSSEPEFQSRSIPYLSHIDRRVRVSRDFLTMDPHQRLDNASDSNLGNVSKISGASGTSQGNKARARLLSKMNKLVGPTASIFKHSASPRSTTTISAPTPADPFQITHERDEIPAYIPARPKQPRTSSECQEALEEMFAHARGQDSPQLAEPTSAKSVKKRPVEQRVPNRRYVN